MSALSVFGCLSRLQTGLHLKCDAYVSLRQLLSVTPLRHLQFHGGGRTSNSVLCAVSSTASPELYEPEKEDPVVKNVKLVCPICQRPVVAMISLGLTLATVKGDFQCQMCRTTYANKGGIIDLTIPSRGTVTPLGSAIFQNPIVAYIYERGLRDAFIISNFPGFDEETERALDIFEPVCGEVLLDLSCGPGGFTRRFVSSGKFETVIGSDFSEAMLEQARGFIESDNSVDLNKVVLVRADAARLPFETASLAGVHAAAAIHCWPNVQTSVAEISRVLKPGGIFVASTFLLPFPGVFDEAVKPLRETVNLLQLQLKWFTEGDLRGYVESCGFVNFQSYIRGIYIMFSATKPD